MISKITLSPECKKLAKLFDMLAPKMRMTRVLRKYSDYYTQRDMRTILKYVKKSHSILDVGGGFGRIAIPLAKLGFSVVLLDISERLIKRAVAEARKAGVAKRLEFVVGDILNLGELGRKFDAIICLRDVLNSVNGYYEKALDNLRDTLNRNGYLIISVGTRFSYLLRKDKSFEEICKAIFSCEAVEEGIKFVVFDVDEIAKALAKRGFKIIEIGGDSIILQSFGGRRFDFFRGKGEKLRLIKEFDEKLIRRNPDFVEHLIIVAKKGSKVD